MLESAESDFCCESSQFSVFPTMVSLRVFICGCVVVKTQKQKRVFTSPRYFLDHSFVFDVVSKKFQHKNKNKARISKWRLSVSLKVGNFST